jgi:hypothetical protein
MESMVAASVSHPGMSSSGWALLPAKVLRNISDRLHYAHDFVRFYAVCRAWRDSHL